jgi:hypothetical protein
MQRMAPSGAAARWTMLATLVGFAWLPWALVWTILIITASFANIWALIAHGRNVIEV